MKLVVLIIILCSLFIAILYLKSTVLLLKSQILNEQVFDLLGMDSSSSNKSEEAFLAKPVVPERVPLKIRETNGENTLAGVSEAEVRKKEEMASYLSRGSLSRATGSTNMNSQSRYFF